MYYYLRPFRSWSRVYQMTLSDKDVAYVAHLARLEVSDDEIADYTAKLSSIFDLVAQLGDLDTTGVTPMAHPLNMTQRLRPDEITEVVQRDEYQSNARSVDDGLYRVPRVIE